MTIRCETPEHSILTIIMQERTRNTFIIAGY
jgi:hypothetical protein